jgi:penicillin-binding protein 1C
MTPMALSNAERVLLERRLQRLHRKKSSSKSAVMVLAVLLAVPLAVVGAGVVAAGVTYMALADELQQGLARLQHLDQRTAIQTTVIRDRNGTVLREWAEQGKRTLVTLDEVPERVRQATIAVEDKTFYTNPGVDPVGFSRAAVGLLTGQSSSGGGSTITQQFVRWVAFSYKERTTRSPTRKIKEIILSLILTRQYSKDQILELYLNEIFYGNNAYGIEAASQTVFGKSIKDVTLAEAALLAGLPQAPNNLDPLNPDPDVLARVKARQATVLDLMAENGFITQVEADAAKNEPLAFAEKNTAGLYLAPHFVEWVAKQLEEVVGPERVAQGGLDVTTTLDLPTQDMAQRIVTEQVEKLKPRHDMSNGALVAMEPRTGQVLAMVGSVDYWNKDMGGNVNVALRERQPGSSIKPLAYVTGLDNNLTTATMLWDVKMEMYIPRKYEPQNYDEKFHGPVRLRTALANSYNIPALKVLAAIQPTRKEDAGKSGVELVIDAAHRMGVTGLNQDPGVYGLSLTLGGGEVTLLDLTNAYSTLANGGEMVRPHSILKVTDNAGNVLYDLSADKDALKPQRAVSAAAAYIITNILSDNAARAPAFGTNSPLNVGVPAAVKTGTTNEYKDNWTLGYTPYLTVGVWAGNNDNHAMKNVSGVAGAAPIWNSFLRGVVNDSKRRKVVRDARRMFGFDTPTAFTRPKDVVDGQFCRLESLNQMAATCPEYQKDLFIAGTEPGHAPAEGAPIDPAAAPTRGDVWTTTQAVVVPLPPAPPDAVDAEGKPVKQAPALLCLAGGGDYGADKAQPVAVLPLPADERERQFTLEWAAANGWAALEPSQPCTPDMVAAAMAPGSLLGALQAATDLTGTLGTGLLPLPRLEYRLNLARDSTLAAHTVLTGTVRYDPNVVEYYKVELGQGRRPVEWITLGDVHREQVQDGPIETLDAPSLPPGDYVVRLVIVGKDGNFLRQPFAVPIRLGQPAP